MIINFQSWLCHALTFGVSLHLYVAHIVKVRLLSLHGHVLKKTFRVCSQQSWSLVLEAGISCLPSPILHRGVVLVPKHHCSHFGPFWPKIKFLGAADRRPNWKQAQRRGLVPWCGRPFCPHQFTWQKVTPRTG